MDIEVDLKLMVDNNSVEIKNIRIGKDWDATEVLSDMSGTEDDRYIYVVESRIAVTRHLKQRKVNE